VEGEPRFTVVVPTRDRPRSLASCLAALERQDANGSFEILVIDDGSTDAALVATMVEASPRATLVRTDPGGSIAARNRGVREARSPLIMFLDDDCEPHPSWARLLLARLGDAHAAAGRCVNADPGDVFGSATQVILDYLTLRSVTGEGWTRFAPTYNLACRRDLMLDLPFDARYVNSGADRDWCARLVRDGRQIALEQRALGFWRKHRAYGAGSARFHSRNDIGLERPAFYVGLLREGFRRGLRVGLAVCLAQLATAIGYASVVLTGRRNRAALEPEGDADGRGDVGYARPPRRRARA
jgi:glycosyltransferase involved in cell wall biosynthesis